ncbi:hypothetical protein GLW05_15440 [Pontibacillus yanchengensis]|uniref:Uncharacterized protein n=1 Tax=Pontibacillus yanchengensis TaxID=462910 RepID=A0A6I5A1U6_9BACI|nr:hypothetical protein [Pontibacillus yanchengensis]MYL34977.1 hypothetical protein [Pontibacillus yanchengensis]
MKTFIHRLKIILGWIIIGYSIAMGITSMTIDDNSIATRIIMYILIGIIPSIIGGLLLKGKKQFMQSLWQYVRYYTFITLFIPFAILLFDNYTNWKESIISHPSDIYLALHSAKWVSYTELALLFLTFLLLAPVYVKGWNWLPKGTRKILIVLFIVTPVFLFVTKEDYQSIREEGIVISSFGNQEEISWGNIKKVELVSYIGSDGLPSRSIPIPEQEFKWKFVFYQSTGETHEFRFGYSVSNSKAALDIKQTILDHDLPLKLDQLTEKEWKFVQLDMNEYPNGKKDFYQLFQYNPETDRYYQQGS